MTALDRALIKAYRADLRGPAADAVAARVSRIDHGMASAPDARLTIHPAEPLLAGPHFRILSQATDATGAEPAFSHREAEFDHADDIVFRLDVGISGMPTSPRQTRVQQQTLPALATPEVALLASHEPLPHHASASSLTSVAEAAPELPDDHQRVRIVREPPPVVPLAPIEQNLSADKSPAVNTSVEDPPVEPVSPEATSIEAVHLTSRPLSSYASEEPSADEARPQFVVDRFSWPEACGNLRHQARESIERFADELTTAGTKVCRAIAFVSTESGVGCTTTTLCLARQLALAGLRPALVDANFSRPRLADELSVKAAHGWDAAMAGEVPLGEVLIESLEDQIVLAPLVETSSAAPLLSASLRTSLIWRMLREPHDILLFDAGNLEDPSSLENLRCLCETAPLDGVYAVCDARSTTPHDVVAWTHRLKDSGIKLLGLIENFAPREQRSAHSALSLH